MMPTQFNTMSPLFYGCSKLMVILHPINKKDLFIKDSTFVHGVVALPTELNIALFCPVSLHRSLKADTFMLNISVPQALVCSNV